MRRGAAALLLYWAPALLAQPGLEQRAYLELFVNDVSRDTVLVYLRGADTPDALSHAASAIFAVLERTAARGTEEMCIVESAEWLVHPKRRFECIAIGP